MILDHSSTRLPAHSIWLAHWIFFGAACNVAGWSLSAVHQLNVGGLAIAIPLAWFLMAKVSGLSLPPLRARIRRNRYTRLFPAAFLLLAILSLLGGLLHPPNNLDALIYRMPRVCHWLMAGQWEWIVTDKNNLNTRAAGIEWWSAPFIAILRTDRLLFLINWVSYLFLPGLFFSLFRHLGARQRVAATWMWILPSGYCLVLQAASVGNDMLAAFFAVAAFDFGFRWKRTGSYPAFALAMVAAAMMTAIKPTTLPLLLPFAVFFFGVWKPVISKPLSTLALAAFCILASFLPTAAINIRQCGDWTGAAAEDQKLGSVEPLVGIATNTVNTVLQNAAPPVFPLAGKWNQWVRNAAPDGWVEANLRSFEQGGACFALPDFQGEELSGIGFGITGLWVLSWVMGLSAKRSGPACHTAAPIRSGRWALAALLFSIALTAYFSRAGMSTVGRHIAPYYPFLFALGLCGSCQSMVVRSRVWRFAAALVIASTVAFMVIVPSRPLWPARTFLARVTEDSPRILQRAKTGYDVYATRGDALGRLRDALPADAMNVGYLSHGVSPELPLWKPYMKRRLRHLTTAETPDELRAEGIRHLVLNTQNFERKRGMPPEAWVRHHGGIVHKRHDLQLLAQNPPTEWWVVEFPR